MYCVYVLKSLANDDLYVGSAENIKNRLKLHNAGKVKSTKGYKPWRLVKYEECGSRSEAAKRERFLKTGQQKEMLRKKYGVATW